MWRTYGEEAVLVSDDEAFTGAQLHINLFGTGTAGVEFSTTNYDGGTGYPLVFQVDGSAVDYQHRFIELKSDLINETGEPLPVEIFFRSAIAEAPGEWPYPSYCYGKMWWDAAGFPHGTFNFDHPVVAENVTSGVNPGHTHTAISITEADPVFSAWRTAGVVDATIVRRHQMFTYFV